MSEQKDIYDTIDSISGRIQLPADFCNLVTSKNELIEKVFPNIIIILPTKYTHQ